MFEINKGRYLTRGINAEIPLEIQIVMWNAIDSMPDEKDYLQVFRLSADKNIQVIRHTAEQPEYEKTYMFQPAGKPVTAKIFVIDDGDHCTMMLAEEY